MNTTAYSHARVLIVDDQEFNIRLLERVLKQGGYANFRSVTDPRTVAVQFRDFQPDLILLDLMMPYLDGIEVMEQLQPLLAPGTYLPIVILTADINPESKRRALAAGACDFLSKPLDNLEVLLRIHNLLETRFLYLQLQAQNQALERIVRERTRDAARAGQPDGPGQRRHDRPRPERPHSLLEPGSRAALRLGRRRGAGPVGRRAAARGREEGLLPRRELVQKKEWHGELRHYHRDGRELIVQSRVTLVADDEGRPRALFAINSDVTAEKSLEKQLQRAQRMESVGALAGGVAHDLNNMMTPILMGVGLLRRTVPDPTAQAMLETMRLSAQCGTELVKQILTFVRGSDEQRRELLLPPFLGEVVNLIAKTFPPTVQVRLAAAPDLWPVNADVTQLYQVLMNLCINARDAMPQGGTLTIRGGNRAVDADEAARRGTQPGRYVVLTVEDTGTGIAPDHLGRIFDPLFTTKEVGQGTGLGLSTVANIVKKHDGFIEVASELQRGSRFAVYLPAVEAAVPCALEALGRPLPEGRGELILVVEDEGAIREITRNALEASGYRVLTAQDGAEAAALFAARRGAVRLVLVDMLMPVMDGPATIRALQQLDPQVVVVAMSAERPERRDVAAELGVRGVLLKPFTADQLLTTLHEVLAAPAAELAAAT